MEVRESSLTVSEDVCEVSILGTGNFGQALAGRLLRCGVAVTVGSRSPGVLPSGLTTVSQVEALKRRIVVVAIPAHFFSSLPLEDILPGTVLVDCSNRVKTCKEEELSQAEELQAMVGKGVTVVKAFNTLSAYEFENNISAGGRELPIAGSEQWAKDGVRELIQRMGYRATDLGNLKAAREIENIPLSFFPEWRAPLIVSSLLWLLLYLIIFFRGQTCVMGRVEWSWEGIIEAIDRDFNQAFDAHAITLLAACYLPGVVAAYLQLARGTKYSLFPGWLDSWLKMRKYLGLLMLASASVHGCLYCLRWVDRTPAKREWNEIVYMNAGVLGFGLAVILGITSLPSVSSSLSWREFRAVQSWLGWACLLLCTLHCLINGADNNWKIFKFNSCFWLGYEQLPIILPALTILLKIPLLLPCIDTRITNIRQGVIY